MNKTIITSIVLSTLTSACAHFETAPIAQEREESRSAWQYGKVVYLSLEGSFWGIVSSDGKKFLPLNLDNDFKEEGKEIRFQGQIENDVMTIQQWGTPFQLTKIEESH